MKNLIKITSFFIGLFMFIGFGLVQMTNATDTNIKNRTQIKGEIIVVVTGARLRSTPSLKSKVIGSSKIGEIYSVSRKSGDWYEIELANGRTAWISGTIVEDYTNSKRDVIYQEIGNKYINREDLDYKTASEVFGFLTMARNEVENRNAQAALELKRLRMLQRTLEAIPIEKARPWEENEVSEYKDLVNVNKNEIVYSEPAGQWLVDADALWNLQKKYKDLPIADDIAWEAATTMIPGECEGFIGCHLPLLVSMEGTYLKLYPRGKYSAEALKSIILNLDGMAGNNEYSYEAPVPEERADFDKAIRELRVALEKTSNPQTQRALNLLKQVERKYK